MHNSEEFNSFHRFSHAPYLSSMFTMHRFKLISLYVVFNYSKLFSIPPFAYFDLHMQHYVPWSHGLFCLVRSRKVWIKVATLSVSGHPSLSRRFHGDPFPALWSCQTEWLSKGFVPGCSQLSCHSPSTNRKLVFIMHACICSADIFMHTKCVWEQSCSHVHTPGSWIHILCHKA